MKQQGCKSYIVPQNSCLVPQYSYFVAQDNYSVLQDEESIGKWWLYQLDGANISSCKRAKYIWRLGLPDNKKTAASRLSVLLAAVWRYLRFYLLHFNRNFPGFHTLGCCLEHYCSGLFRTLYKGGELSAEELHVRCLEGLQIGDYYYLSVILRFGIRPLFCNAWSSK